MKLFHISNVADQIMYCDSTWRGSQFRPLSCTNCGYLLNRYREAAIDVVLDPRVDEESRYPTAPWIGIIGVVGCKLVRRDLAEDLRLAEEGCRLGAVLVDTVLVSDYYNVVTPWDRWVLGFDRPVLWYESCKECNRLLMNAQPHEMYAVKESIRARANIYSYLGVSPIVTEEAVGRIRQSLLAELTLREIKIISMKEQRFQGIVHAE